MSTTTWDPTKIRGRAGQVFLAAYAYASTPPADVSTPAAILKEFMAQFYVDGEKQDTLVTGVEPWAYVDAKGIMFDAKFKQLEFDPNSGVKINAGKYLDTCTCGMTIGDMSAAKFNEMLSTTSGEQLAIAAGTGQAGRSSLLIGTTPNNLRYTMLYRWQARDAAGAAIPGQYDHILIPRCILSPDIKVSGDKTKPTDLAVTVTAENDLFLVSPDSGLYAVAVFTETTTKAT